LRGNIEAKLAKFAGDDAAIAAALRAALERVREANRLRKNSDTPLEELARSEYNLAGPYINLSKVERDRAAAHLGDAESVYRSVLTQRRNIYASHVHGHIAACIAGLGVVDYMRALLVAREPAERSALLRSATSLALESAHDREALAGPVDDGDVGKSYRLLAKIAMARHLDAISPDDRAKEHADLLVEVGTELEWPGDLL
jgi:hypothetical protein